MVRGKSLTCIDFLPATLFESTYERAAMRVTSVEACGVRGKNGGNRFAGVGVGVLVSGGVSRCMFV